MTKLELIEYAKKVGDEAYKIMNGAEECELKSMSILINKYKKEVCKTVEDEELFDIGLRLSKERDKSLYQSWNEGYWAGYEAALAKEDS